MTTATTHLILPADEITALRQEIADLRLAVERAVSMRPVGGEPLMTEEQVGEFLGAGRTLMRRLKSEGMPFLDLGTCKRYDREKVVEWLASRKSSL